MIKQAWTLCFATAAARPLKTGEIELARSMFGEEIDYSHVKITSCTSTIRGKGGTVIDDTMFYEKSSYHDDFSNAPHEYRKLFIHEMTHIWQGQHGMNMPWEFLKTLMKMKFKYADAYNFQEGQEETPFQELNFERQARLVDVAYSLRESFKTTKDKEHYERLKDQLAYLHSIIPSEFSKNFKEPDHHSR